MTGARPSLSVVILTTGNRPSLVRQAVASIERHGEAQTILVANGCQIETVGGASLVNIDENVGVPAGRDAGVRASDAPIVGFLDDDAVAPPGMSDAVVAAFDADPTLGAVALRLVDQTGATARRHVPRLGGRDPDQGGEVALFLGGACAVRRQAYDDVGGYWGDLFYGHEELELSWRLIDDGWSIRYLPEVVVFHPRTEIGRHADGWAMTGRNRVMIARRTLPWPVAIGHVTAWLLLGGVRALRAGQGRAYLGGWLSGWRVRVDRRPIRWRTVWRLTRLRRPPIV